MNGAVKETSQEYFSEITKASKKDENGSAIVAKRQASNKIEYVRLDCNLYSFMSLTESGMEV